MTLTYELLLLWLFPFSGLFQDNLCKPVPERYTRSDVVRQAKCKHAVGVMTAAYD